MKKKILVVAAHPDDEVLGCGGTIKKHSIQKDEIYLIILSSGVSTKTRLGKNQKNERLKHLFNSSKILGINKKNIFINNFPDNEFDTISNLDIAKKIEEYLFIIKPNIIYTHWFKDLNIDHKITANALLTAARPLPKSSVELILGFEILSNTEWEINNSARFSGNIYTDIEKTIDFKLKAMKEYKNELRASPHPRSLNIIKNKASVDGSSCGSKYAERFHLYYMKR